MMGTGVDAPVAATNSRPASPDSTAVSATANGRLPLASLAAYGCFGVPLAMAALPLYVHLPNFYGAHLGVDLATLGALLLVLRLADGVLDPLLGTWSDRLRSRKTAIIAAAPVLAIGMIALFEPIPRAHAPLLAWLGVSLALVYLAFSFATINHNAWGAELSTDPVERTRITAVREGLALLGVVVASVAPTMLAPADAPETGLARFAWCYAGIALCAALVLTRAPSPPRRVQVRESAWSGVRVPLADPQFRRLLVVFLANGIASAIPATLVLFFVADVLQATTRQGFFLALYFIAGAVGMPLWVKLSAGVGKTRAWAISMVAAIVAFVWAWGLGAGDVVAFAVICVMSGLTLGADLALPPSLLADVIDRGGTARPAGAYFGLWTLATKLNLALAAGIALPLLGALGYAPGTSATRALSALALVYAAVPCVLKAIALGALFHFERNSRR